MVSSSPHPRSLQVSLPPHTLCRAASISSSVIPVSDLVLPTALPLRLHSPHLLTLFLRSLEGLRMAIQGL